MIGQVFWCFFYAAVVSYGRRLINEPAMQVVNFVSVVILGYLGIDLLVATVERLPGMFGVG